MFLITNFMIEAIPVSVANLVHAPLGPAKMCVQGAGGGNRPIIVNADCIRSIKKRVSLFYYDIPFSLAFLKHNV